MNSFTSRSLLAACVVLTCVPTADSFVAPSAGLLSHRSQLTTQYSFVRPRVSGKRTVSLRSGEDKSAKVPATNPVEESAVAVPKVSVSSLDPAAALKGQADTMSQFMTKLGEYKACKDKEQRKIMEGEIIDMYVEFAVPALALALGTLVAFPGAFAFFFAGLGISGRGLPDIQGLVGTLPSAISTPVSDMLAKVDPTLGNAAVAAVLVELTSPLLLLLSAAIKGKIEENLNAKLPEWGLDGEGLRERLDRLAGPDGDLF